MRIFGPPLKRKPAVPRLPFGFPARLPSTRTFRGVRLTRLASDRRASPEPSCYPAGPSCAPNAGRMGTARDAGGYERHVGSLFPMLRCRGVTANFLRAELWAVGPE